MTNAEFRTETLKWADVVMYFTFFVMQQYLTDIWKLSFTTAATFINLWEGIYRVLPIFFLYLADTIVGNFVMLALSGIFSTLGLIVVTVTTREGYNCNKKGEAECVGRMDKTLFIIGMLLIAIGRAARFASAKPFIQDQTNQDETNNNNHMTNHTDAQTNNNNNNQTTNHDDDQADNNDGTITENPTATSWWSKITDFVGTTSTPWLVIYFINFLCMPSAAFITFPLVKKWYFLFGASAVCTLVATFSYLSSSREYKKPGPISGRSPITNLLRVFVAACHKRSQPPPAPDDPRLYVMTTDEEFQKLSDTRCLGRLHKAAIQLDSDIVGGWTLCSVSEVESAKIVIRMLSVYTTYLMGGIVSSVGNTYVVEQALNMNYNIGHWEPPLQLIQLLFTVVKFFIEKSVYTSIVNGNDISKEGNTVINVGMANTVNSVICCTVSAAVERRRVHAVRRPDLVGQPDDAKVHMGAYWLLFQVLFLGFVKATLLFELSYFHKNEAPNSMKRYNDCLGEGVVGVGFMCGALSVYVVRKFSEIGSSKDWFRHTLNKSRLDRYYWVLAVLSALNIFWCNAVNTNYRSKRPVPPTPAPIRRRPRFGRVTWRTCADILMG